MSRCAGVCSLLVRGTLEQALLLSRAVQMQSSLIAEWHQQMAWRFRLTKQRMRQTVAFAYLRL